jgi:hypothetical protein
MGAGNRGGETDRAGAGERPLKQYPPFSRKLVLEGAGGDGLGRLRFNVNGNTINRAFNHG